MLTLSIKTKQRCAMVDITGQVEALLPELGISDGVVQVFSPHTTAGVTINEACDPDVARDMLYYLDKLVCHDDSGFRHAEGNSAAHAKAAATGSSATVIVRGGRLLLGTWQGIYFCEFDGPRARRYYCKLAEDKA